MPCTYNVGREKLCSGRKYEQMNSQELEHEVLQQAENTAAIAFESAETGLLLLLERFPEYFKERATQDDIETLVFCLHRLYNCSNTLYRHILPDLAHAVSLQGTPPHSTFACRHAIWEQLQFLQQLIERVESHCHLLLNSATCVLAILVLTEEVAVSVEIPTHVGTDQWQHAYERLSTSLTEWQERSKNCASFAIMFANIAAPLSMASLTQVDIALALLFDSANAIFGDIIPDIQLVAQGDDEVVATLLFDLMQQNDLLLMQIGKLVEPIQQLIKYYEVME